MMYIQEMNTLYFILLSTWYINSNYNYKHTYIYTYLNFNWNLIFAKKIYSNIKSNCACNPNNFNKIRESFYLPQFVQKFDLNLNICYS